MPIDCEKSNFLELCTHRQSCRDFSTKPVEHEKLVNCIEAARLTPSACNSQPWSFVVVENKEILPKVANATMQLGANAYIANAQAFVIVLEEHAVLMPRIRSFLDSQYFAKHDLGAATLSICLAAEAQGLGSCILGLFNREELCNLLEIPIEKQIAVVIALGYPNSSEVRPKVRKSVEEIAKFV